MIPVVCQADDMGGGGGGLIYPKFSLMLWFNAKIGLKYIFKLFSKSRLHAKCENSFKICFLAIFSWIKS